MKSVNQRKSFILVQQQVSLGKIQSSYSTGSVGISTKRNFLIVEKYPPMQSR